MPNFITHSIHGLKVLDLSLNEASNVFLLGCQGADLFFYKDAKFGKMLHEDQSKKFLFYLVKNSKTEIQRLYSMGYACHITLDGIAHPYINYRTHTPKTHTKFELIIDTILLKKELRKDWNYKFINHLKIDGEFLEQLADLYVESFKDTFNMEFDRNIVKKSCSSMIKILNFFHDPNRKKTPLVYLIKWLTFNKIDYTFMIYPIIDEREFPDPLNLTRKSWIDPLTGVEKNTSFLELLEVAVSEAKKLKNQLFQ